MHDAAREANQRMVDRLIARGALWSRAAVAAFRATPRHRFLDRVFHLQEGGWREVDTRDPGRAELRLLYADRALTTRLSEPGPDRPALPISSSSQPSLMAEMLEDLALCPGMRVLEVGAGTGYNTALLAHLVGGRVVSLDVDRRVLEEAREHLLAFPDRAVEFVHGDGRAGLPAAAPFDRILVTAAAPDLEPAWLGQVAEGGMVQAPLELAPGLAFLVRGSMVAGHFAGRLTRPAYFMPLRAEDESGRPAGSGAPSLPAPESLSAVAAPWAGWGPRRAAGSFLQALAFLGWLRGLTVSYQMIGDRAVYGVGNLVRGHVCWLGAREWRVTGPAGRDLGRQLWRLFLKAGGPRPTEFVLRARPPGETAEVAETPGVRLRFRRRGPCCVQTWELPEDRERPVGI